MASITSAVPSPVLVNSAAPKQRPKSSSKHKMSPGISLFSGGVAGAVEAAVTVDGGTWDGLSQAVKDPFTWIFCLMHFALVTAQSFKDFLPSIVKTFDFNELMTNLIQAPPYAFAYAFACLVAWSSGRRQESFWHVVLPTVGS